MPAATMDAIALALAAHSLLLWRSAHSAYSGMEASTCYYSMASESQAMGLKLQQESKYQCIGASGVYVQ